MWFTLQRYELFSKSQRNVEGEIRPHDVVYPTKVRIFQQITTRQGMKVDWIEMLFTLQRYEFFSKSQQEWEIVGVDSDVVYPTNLHKISEL